MDVVPNLQLVNNTGLKAEQNICFVNVVVQLLNNVTNFQAYFKKRYYKLEMAGSKKTEICDELSNLFILSGKRYCSAATLRNLVASVWSQYSAKFWSQKIRLNELIF